MKSLSLTLPSRPYYLFKDKRDRKCVVKTTRLIHIERPCYGNIFAPIKLRVTPNWAFQIFWPVVKRLNFSSALSNTSDFTICLSYNFHTIFKVICFIVSLSITLKIKRRYWFGQDQARLNRCKIWSQICWQASCSFLILRPKLVGFCRRDADIKKTRQQLVSVTFTWLLIKNEVMNT